MEPTTFMFPALAMVALTALVWVGLYVERFGEMNRRGIEPKALSTSREAKALLSNIKFSDNFSNLFEVPVLFYVLCLALTATGVQLPWIAAGLWVFVLLRALHSFIHCTYNNVMHRFLMYAASTLLLFVMWAAYAVILLRPS